MNDHDALSVAQFCKRHGISRATLYNLLRDGVGPRIMKVGSRTLISAEAARAWRERLEAEASPAKATAV
jgi:excisionase family DNA binding protein